MWTKVSPSECTKSITRSGSATETAGCGHDEGAEQYGRDLASSGKLFTHSTMLADGLRWLVDPASGHTVPDNSITRSSSRSLSGERTPIRSIR